MMDATKYHVGYYPPPVEPGHVYEWTKKDHIEKAPAWCSVDLRDGNQSLIVPMSLDEKLEFYDMLIKIGFKEIEVGFPAASETEYEFLRKLIDGNRIPQDVTVQVLTQCRDHIIRKNVRGRQGCAPRHHPFLQLHQRRPARAGVQEVAKRRSSRSPSTAPSWSSSSARSTRATSCFEYSPESFTGTEPEYAAGSLQRRAGHHAAHAGPPRDHQPAGHGGDEHAATSTPTRSNACSQPSEVP